MSLDELSRKWERTSGTGTQSQEDANIKQIIGTYFSEKNIDTKTRLPDADAFADMETIIQWVKDEFGEKCSKYLELRLKRFKIDVLSQDSKSRDEVRDMVKAARQTEEIRGKSILERLNRT